MRYRIETHPIAPNELRVHVDKKLFEKKAYCLENNSSDSLLDWGAENENQKEVDDIAQDILGIEGVKGLLIDIYSVTIEKGEMFEWEEILPAVIYYLNEYLDPDGRAINVNHPRQASQQFPSIIIGNFGPLPQSRR